MQCDVFSYIKTYTMVFWILTPCSLVGSGTSPYHITWHKSRSQHAWRLCEAKLQKYWISMNYKPKSHYMMKVHNQKAAMKRKMLRSEMHDKIHACNTQLPLKSERCNTNKSLTIRFHILKEGRNAFHIWKMGQLYTIEPHAAIINQSIKTPSFN